MDTIEHTIRGSSFKAPSNIGRAFSLTALICNPTSSAPRYMQAAIYTEADSHILITQSIQKIVNNNTDDPRWINFPLQNSHELVPNKYYVLVVWAGKPLVENPRGLSAPKLCHTGGDFTYQGHSLGHYSNVPPGPLYEDGLPSRIESKENSRQYFDENQIKYCIYCFAHIRTISMHL